MVFFGIMLLPLSWWGQVDTFDIKMGRADILQVYGASYRPLDTTGNYVINDDYKIDSAGYSAFESLRDSLKIIWNDSYCRFWVDGVLREEGHFYIENITGNYSKYDRKGKLTCSGTLDANGVKVGPWKYVKANGEIKTKNYRKPRFWRFVEVDRKLSKYKSQEEFFLDYFDAQKIK